MRPTTAMAVAKSKSVLPVLVLLVLAATLAWGEEAVPVNVDNFVRAESDHYFLKRQEDGYFGKLVPLRDPVDVKHQPAVRPNRDTLYSYGVFDLTTPVTITFPGGGKRFQSLRIVDEDEYIYLDTTKPGTYVLTQDSVGTRYVHVSVRTLVNPDDPADIKAAHEQQDTVIAKQDAPGKLELPNWDQDQLAQVRKAILGLGPFLPHTLPDTHPMFGRKDQVDEVHHLIGAAGGWGGGPEESSMYVSVIPEKNDGKTPYALTVRDVPVDGFWSVSLYNKEGYFVENQFGAYSLNMYTAKPNADGSFTINFGDAKQKNFLYIMPGWNYTVRLYLPRPVALNGTWTFPKPQPVK